MKQFTILSTFICLAFCLSGCDIDNYDAPDSTFAGKFVTKNGDPVYQRVEGSSSLRIALYETKREVSLTQQFYTKLDGTFQNAMLFGNEYKVQLEQINFFPIEDQIIDVRGYTDHTYTVVPFCEVKNAVATKAAGQQVNVKFSLSREDGTDCKINSYAIYWNASPYVDDQSINRKGEYIVSTSEADSGLLGKTMDHTVDITELMESYGHIIQANNNEIYLRVAVTTSYKGNLYTNFSEVLTVKVN